MSRLIPALSTFRVMRINHRRLTIVGLVLLYGLHCLPAYACTTCNRPLQEAISGADFFGIFLKMMLPVLLLGLVIRFLYRLR